MARSPTIPTMKICTETYWKATSSYSRRWLLWLLNGKSVKRGLMTMWMNRYTHSSHTRAQLHWYSSITKNKHWLRVLIKLLFLQLLFKVEGQSLTNQRTEPHKSLISKNVSVVIKSNWYQCLQFNFHICLVLRDLVLFSSPSQTLKSKQRMLKEDWEFFKQRKFIEEQVLLLNTVSLW